MPRRPAIDAPGSRAQSSPTITICATHAGRPGERLSQASKGLEADSGLGWGVAARTFFPRLDGYPGGLCALRGQAEVEAVSRVIFHDEDAAAWAGDGDDGGEDGGDARGGEDVAKHRGGEHAGADVARVRGLVAAAAACGAGGGVSGSSACELTGAAGSGWAEGGGSAGDASAPEMRATLVLSQSFLRMTRTCSGGSETTGMTDLCPPKADSFWSCVFHSQRKRQGSHRLGHSIEVSAARIDEAETLYHLLDRV